MTATRCAQLLTLTGWGFVIFGLIWVTTAFAGFDAPGRHLIDLLVWPKDGLPAEPSPEARLMGAIGAGLTCGVGLFFTLIIAPVIKSGHAVLAPKARKGTLIAMTVWFVVDSTGSITSGAPSNAVFNFMFYLLVTIPLLMVKFE